LSGEGVIVILFLLAFLIWAAVSAYGSHKEYKEMMKKDHSWDFLFKEED
jgi:hypothetical protein